MYTTELWSANARLEYRDSDIDERNSLLFGWYRQPGIGHGLSAGLTLFQVQSNNIDETIAADLKFGWAYRMADNKWSFLNRIDLIGFDLRRGMRGRFDLGVNTSIYHSYESSVIDYGFGIDVGYNFASNMWVTLGYNIAGFHDSDFTEARDTAQGPLLRFSMKADQQALKRVAGRK